MGWPAARMWWATPKRKRCSKSSFRPSSHKPLRPRTIARSGCADLYCPDSSEWTHDAAIAMRACAVGTSLKIVSVAIDPDARTPGLLEGLITHELIGAADGDPIKDFREGSYRPLKSAAIDGTFAVSQLNRRQPSPKARSIQDSNSHPYLLGFHTGQPDRFAAWPHHEAP